MRLKRKNRIILALAAGLLLAAALTLLFVGRGRRAIPLSRRIPNNGEVVAAIRKGLREHSRQITVTFSYKDDVLDELTALTGDWIEQALAETDDPTEGDYIRYQYGGYESSSRYEKVDGRYDYTVEIVPRYYLYLVEEETVTERLDEVMAGFGFDDTTPDYEKIRAIYDYVCGTVRYDKVHLKHPTATMRSTAYAALIWHTATCQGYCVLLYRMLRMAGIETRIITGNGYGGGREEFHAWNIVGVDGKYYALDATWDAGQEEYRYFLKGTDNFTDHIPGEAFQTKDFARRYPMAAEDYSFAG